MNGRSYFENLLDDVVSEWIQHHIEHPRFLDEAIVSDRKHTLDDVSLITCVYNSEESFDDAGSVTMMREDSEVGADATHGLDHKVAFASHIIH